MGYSTVVDKMAINKYFFDLYKMFKLYPCPVFFFWGIYTGKLRFSKTSEKYRMAIFKTPHKSSDHSLVTLSKRLLSRCL